MLKTLVFLLSIISVVKSQDLWSPKASRTGPIEYRPFDNYDFNSAESPISSVLADSNIQLRRFGDDGMMFSWNDAIRNNPAYYYSIIVPAYYTGNTSVLPGKPRAVTAAGQPYVRIATAAYAADGYSPRISVNKTALPLPRNITQSLFTLGDRFRVANYLNELHMFLGGYVALDLTAPADGLNSSCPMRHKVPKGDEMFDPSGSGTRDFAFNRQNRMANSQFLKGLLFKNGATPALDLSQLYGTVEEIPPADESTKVRTFVDGKIQENGLYTNNVQYTPNQKKFRYAGDQRINANPVLLVIDTVWRREHNRLAAALKVEHPSWNDDALFHEARRWNIAFYQKIVSREWLTPYCGSLSRYLGFIPSTDPRVPLEFSTAAFRTYHRSVGEVISKRDSSFESVEGGDIPLPLSIWHPELIYGSPTAIEDILRGAISQAQDKGRMAFNILNLASNGDFPTYSPSQDLLAIDIQRGRDLGLPTYNAYLMKVSGASARKATYAQMTTDIAKQKALAMVYGPNNVDDVDLIVGLHIEDINVNSIIGTTARSIVRNALLKVRDADRFWYENIFTSAELDIVYATNFSSIIVRNTNVNNQNWTASSSKRVANDVFFSSSLAEYSNAVTVSVNPADHLPYTHWCLLSNEFLLEWRTDASNIHFRLTVAALGYVSVGFNPEQLHTMKGGDYYYLQYYPGQPVLGTDAYGFDVGDIKSDERLNGGSNCMFDLSFQKLKNGINIASFSRPLLGGAWDYNFTNVGKVQVLGAWHPLNMDFGYHGPSRVSNVWIDFFAPQSVTFTVEEDDKTLAVVFFCLAVVLLGVSVLLMILLVSQRRQPVIISASFLFLIVLLIGSGLCYGAVMMNASMEGREDGWCMGQFWLAGFGYVLIYGSTFLKAFRIHSIFNDRNLQIVSKTSKIGPLSNCRLLIYIFLFGCVEGAVMTAWTVVDPMILTLVSLDERSKSYLRTCATQHTNGFLYAWIAYKVLFLIWGTYLSVRTRNVNVKYGESTVIGFSIYASVITLLFGTIFGFFLNNTPNSFLFVFSAVILMAVTFTMLVQILPKLILTLCPHDHDDVSVSGIAGTPALTSRGNTRAAPGKAAAASAAEMGNTRNSVVERPISITKASSAESPPVGKVADANAVEMGNSRNSVSVRRSLFSKASSAAGKSNYNKSASSHAVDTKSANSNGTNETDAVDTKSANSNGTNETDVHISIDSPDERSPSPEHTESPSA